MGKNKGMPRYYGKNIAMQAERRYLAGGKPESKRVEENREASANVISICWLMSLNDLYGVGETRLYRVMDAANAEVGRFDLNKKKMGLEWAKKELDKELDEHGAFGFMLPVISAPKKRRDWEMLSERRDAAESVIKLYILGTKKALGYGPDRLERAVRATEENFRHFGDYAKDGDYYGYEVLAKRLEQLFHTQIAVKEEKTDEPIFGKSLT